MEVDTQEKPRPLTHYQKLNSIYTLPAPFRVFPLPNLVPHNPLSLIHIIYVWISQTIKPPTSRIEPLYQGWFSSCTRSVHVIDSRSIRGLWEQGFYGKGSLSRSEPNWLDGEKARRENKGTVTSEEYTRRRRAERQRIKWDRARKERQAIDQKLLEEASVFQQNPCALFSRTEPQASLEIKCEMMSPVHQVLRPVGPMELLSLPNSHNSMCRNLKEKSEGEEVSPTKNAIKPSVPPTGPLELLSLPNSQSDLQPLSVFDESIDGYQEPYSEREASPHLNRDDLSSSAGSNYLFQQKACYRDPGGDLQLRNKNARSIACRSNIHGADQVYELPKENDDALKLTSPFEPTGISSSIETNQSNMISDNSQNVTQNAVELSGLSGRSLANNPQNTEAPSIIANEEHFQLTLQEAFFLSYAFGCLEILDPVTKLPISAKSLFQRCQRESHFPPQSNQIITPDDSFLVNYVVYHHFRSLGWVVRSGIKFSVDYMLYNRGPVFSHAEFAVIILPSYSDPYWNSTEHLREYSQRKQYRSWAWMSCINRVITQVKKTLVLCYVDIPRPMSIEEEKKSSPKSVLERYKIREFILNRFLANRLRA